MSRGYLLAVFPDGRTEAVPNTYEAIKQALDDATFDFARFGAGGFFVDDEGLLKGLQFNMVASLTAARALYGPAVLAHGDPDSEGETLPPARQVVEVCLGAADVWVQIQADALMSGQSLAIYASAETVPPPTFTSFTMADFDEMFGLRPRESDEGD